MVSKLSFPINLESLIKSFSDGSKLDCQIWEQLWHIKTLSKCRLSNSSARQIGGMCGADAKHTFILKKQRSDKTRVGDAQINCEQFFSSGILHYFSAKKKIKTRKKVFKRSIS